MQCINPNAWYVLDSRTGESLTRPTDEAGARWVASEVPNSEPIAGWRWRQRLIEQLCARRRKPAPVQPLTPEDIVRLQLAGMRVN